MRLQGMFLAAFGSTGIILLLRWYMIHKEPETAIKSTTMVKAATA